MAQIVIVIVVMAFLTIGFLLGMLIYIPLAFISLLLMLSFDFYDGLKRMASELLSLFNDALHLGMKASKQGGSK